MAIITMVNGDDIDIVYTIKDENDAVIDLTGGSITWNVVVNGTTTQVFAKSSPSSGVVLTTPASGIATVTLTPSDTSSLKGTYGLDGTFTDASSNVYTFETGHLVIS